MRWVYENSKDGDLNQRKDNDYRTRTRKSNSTVNEIVHMCDVTFTGEVLQLDVVDGAHGTTHQYHFYTYKQDYTAHEHVLVQPPMYTISLHVFHLFSRLGHSDTYDQDYIVHQHDLDQSLCDSDLAATLVHFLPPTVTSTSTFTLFKSAR